MKLKDIDIGNLRILQGAVNDEVLRRKREFEAREEEEEEREREENERLRKEIKDLIDEKEHLEEVLEAEGVI